MTGDLFLIHTIAAVLLKLADLVAGILLCFLGKSLFERGIRSDFTGEGTVSTVKFRIVTSSPGAIFLVAGLAIVISSVVTQAKFVESVQGSSVGSPQGGKVEASQVGKVQAPESNKVEVAQANKVETVESRLLHTDVSNAPLRGSTKALSPEASELCSMLLIYTQLHGTVDEDRVKAGDLIKQIPTAPPQGSVDSTKQLLRQMFAASPFSLLRVLNDGHYHWILENPVIVADLTDLLKEAFDHK